jgi:hypothetical protein
MARYAPRSGAAGVALAAALAAARAHADPLLGDVGATLGTLDGVAANPANAAFLERTQVGIAPELYRQESLSIRYPGFESVTESDSGLSGPLQLGRPSFIWKPTPRLGLGGYLIPPIGLGLDVHKSRIPVVVLDTQNFVDLDARGELKGAAQFTLGYRFGDRVGFGANASYQKIAYRATLTPSDTNEALATIEAEQSDFDLGIGLRLDLTPGVAAIGVAFGLVNVHAERTTIDSPLIGSLGDGDGDGGSDGANASVANPANSFLVGAMLAKPGVFRLFADARYHRVNKTQTGYSIVELKTKTKDLHDTLAASVGAALSVSPQTELLAGARYEPASLGAGSRGEDGTLGFGTTEVVQIFAGLSPLVPYWQIAGGAQFHFDYRQPRAPRAHKERRDGKGKADKAERDAPPSEGYYAWTIGSGLVYRRASLGIDENGEQPGAYLQTRIAIPLTVTRRL